MRDRYEGGRQGYEQLESRPSIPPCPPHFLARPTIQVATRRLRVYPNSPARRYREGIGARLRDCCSRPWFREAHTSNGAEPTRQRDGPRHHRHDLDGWAVRLSPIARL